MASEDVASPASIYPVPLTVRAAGISIEAEPTPESGSVPIATVVALEDKGQRADASELGGTTSGVKSTKMVVIPVKPIRVVVDFILLFLGK